MKGKLMFRTVLIAIACAAASMAVVPSASAEKPPVYTGIFDDLAVGGYDPVAYFKSGTPVEGSKSFEYKYKDAT